MYSTRNKTLWDVQGDREMGREEEGTEEGTIEGTHGQRSRRNIIVEQAYPRGTPAHGGDMPEHGQTERRKDWQRGTTVN